MMLFALLFFDQTKMIAMLRMTNDVSVGSYKFTGVNEVTVESGWELMTDVCSITVPKKLKWEGKPIALDKDALLKKGDKVTVKLGYNDENNQVFTGYLTNIHADMPIMLQCQDAMWLLKKGNFNKAYRQVTLSTLLKDMLPSVPVKVVAEHDLGMLRIVNATPAKVLNDLRKDYFVKAFFRDGTLYAGLAYVPELQSEHTIRFNRNVVENNLEYVRKDDVKIKLKCVILNPDNKKEEFEIGDSDGEIRTIHKYNISRSAMQTLAEAELERLRYDGYRGSLTIFGSPYVQHGDVVKLIDGDNPERDGRYLVKKVSTKFNQNGYRQTLEIESKV
jgi:hypothetical protein